MSLAQEAHDYAAWGWAVFPLQPRSKKPYGYTTGLHAARADVEVVTAWWAGKAALPLRERRESDGDRPFPRTVVPQPASNIGLRTGAASALWVFDIDGEEGIANLLALTEQHGRLPRTVRQRTGGGGGQLFFTWPGVLPWGAEIRNSASKGTLAPSLDVRGEGGYVVLPPSVHPGDERKGVAPGGVYRWAEGCAPWECELARAPWWLLRVVAPPPAPVPTRAAVADRPSGEGGRGYAMGALASACAEIAGARPGQRNDTFHRNAYGIGRLVAAGELAAEGAATELVNAGLRMGGGDAEFGEAALRGMIERAFRRAEADPRRAPQ